MAPRQIILLVQGTFYASTGVWSVLHRSSFERVTGRKTDYWLVRMVGLLAAVIGLALLVAATSATVPNSIWLLAVGSAASFVAIDVTYAMRGRISRIYLLDAAAESILIVALIVVWWFARR